MRARLPKILMHEPLVEAVFEIRFQGADALADILPGFLFHQLDPKPVISRLPAAEFPKPMRADEPSLRYAPTQRLEWGNYVILIGDHNLMVSCKLPYPKWPSFKSTILHIVSQIEVLGIVSLVERFSVKYVNLIQGKTIADQIGKIEIAIRLGDVEVEDNHLSLQVHRVDGARTHILSVITGAQGMLPNGEQIFGSVVDVDSIEIVNEGNFKVFVDSLPEKVEALRQLNKSLFFSCLTDSAIDEMEPVYE